MGRRGEVGGSGRCRRRRRAPQARSPGSRRAPRQTSQRGGRAWVGRAPQSGDLPRDAMSPLLPPPPFCFVLFCSNFGKVNATCVQKVTEWVRLERTTAGHRVQPRFSQSAWLRIAARWVWNISRAGDSTPSLGNVVHVQALHRTEVLMFRWNFLPITFCPFWHRRTSALLVFHCICDSAKVFPSRTKRNGNKAIKL